MMTPEAFAKDRLGKSVDMDGAYGAQCWDLFAYFCEKVGYPIFNCTESGYAKDLWNQRKISGILNYFDEVSISHLQDGDWVVFTNSKFTPLSHVAMFRKKNGDENSGVFLGQNQNNVMSASEIVISYEGILGVLRPKVYVKFSLPIPSKGKAEALFDEIRIRNVPSLSKGDTGLVYRVGMKINYDSVVVADGWYWMSYVSYSGVRRYCAYGSVDGKKKYWKV